MVFERDMRIEGLFGRDGAERSDQKVVGGRDPVDWDASKMEELLHSYRDRAYKCAVLGEKDERLKLLDSCLDALLPYERDLIDSLCAKRVSEKTYAQHVGITRYRVRCEKARILSAMASVFTEYYRAKALVDPT